MIVFLCFKTNIKIFLNYNFLKLTLFVDKPTKRKKNSENVNNKKYARNNLEKFFASNEMREREHLNQKFTKRDTDSLNRKIQENEKKPGV